MYEWCIPRPLLLAISAALSLGYGSMNRKGATKTYIGGNVFSVCLWIRILSTVYCIYVYIPVSRKADRIGNVLGLHTDLGNCFQWENDATSRDIFVRARFDSWQLIVFEYKAWRIFFSICIYMNIFFFLVIYSNVIYSNWERKCLKCMSLRICSKSRISYGCR